MDKIETQFVSFPTGWYREGLQGLVLLRWYCFGSVWELILRANHVKLPKLWSQIQGAQSCALKESTQPARLSKEGICQAFIFMHYVALDWRVTKEARDWTAWNSWIIWRHWRWRAAGNAVNSQRNGVVEQAWSTNACWPKKRKGNNGDGSEDDREHGVAVALRC